MKPAVALDLSLESIKKIALKLHNFPAAQTGHMDVIPLRTTLVKVLLSLHVHQVELVHQAVALEELKRTVNSDTINFGIELLGMTKNLRRVKVLLGIFDHA